MSLFKDLFMKGILFPREYFFLQGANMFNESIEICRFFSKPLQFVSIFSVDNFSKRICQNVSLQKFL